RAPRSSGPPRRGADHGARAAVRPSPHRLRESGRSRAQPAPGEERQRCLMRVSWKVWVLAVVVGLAVASTSAAQPFNWQQAKGTQLGVVLNKHPWQAAIEPHLKDFEALTGVKLVTEVYPEDQFRAKVLVELTSGAGSIDVFMSMPAQEGLKYMH